MNLIISWLISILLSAILAYLTNQLTFFTFLLIIIFASLNYLLKKPAFKILLLVAIFFIFCFIEPLPFLCVVLSFQMPFVPIYLILLTIGLITLSLPFAISVIHFLFALIIIYLAYLVAEMENRQLAFYALEDNKNSELLQTNHLLQETINRIPIQQEHEILKERMRIARDIHDLVGHQLTSAILQVNVLKLNDDLQVKQQLEETLHTALQQIRDTIHDLYEQSQSLQEEIQKLVDAYHFCPINSYINIQQEPQLVFSQAILAIIQEAFSNTAKHSNATQITLRLWQQDFDYRLLIVDNGTKVNTDMSSGIGLATMKNRITALKGMIHISYDNGFRIYVVLKKEE